jgi:cytoplasmic iron level regulating protein YaaA (DUF328/UPF0246 family)
MKLVISPAKSMDFETELPTHSATQPQFLEQSKRLNAALKKKSAKALSKLMGISERLGQLNYERNHNWALPFTSDNARPAIYAFNGDVYKGLDAYTIPNEALDTLQDTVRILSGLYGLLKPTDLIQPYRLEMGTKFGVGTSKNLYEFWKTNIVAALNEELAPGELFLNLASNEYFKAIDKKALKTPVVTANFKDFKNGTYKVISFYAKAARGAMARYVVDTNAQTLDDLKGFNYMDYGFSEALSKDNDLVFTR